MQERLNEVIKNNDDGIKKYLEILDEYAKKIVIASEEAQKYLNARKNGEIVEESVTSTDKFMFKVFETIEDRMNGAEMAFNSLALKSYMKATLEYIKQGD